MTWAFQPLLETTGTGTSDATASPAAIAATVTMAAAAGPMPKNSTNGARYANVGMICITSRIGVMISLPSC